MKKFIKVFLFNIACFTSFFSEAAKNPWPEGTVARGGVFVFNPSDGIEKIQATVNAIYAINGGQPDNGQFSNNRYALLFQPGTYPGLTVPVGYYTSVIGLGASPEDTNMDVVCQEGNFDYAIGALNTFWRSAENFTVIPQKSYWDANPPPVGMLWAVSQASPLRRVHVQGDLYLFQYVNNPPIYAAGYASGGFLANCKVNGVIHSGSQQQWLSRNAEMGGWPEGVWNMVFVGCTGNVPQTNGGSFTNIEKTPLIAEKPYIVCNDAATNSYSLVIPGVEQNKSGALGAATATKISDTVVVPFDKVYIATPSDTAQKITEMLTIYDVILTPGIYNLEESIKIRRHNACLLGIGFPTLVSQKEHACVRVDSISGNVRIGGLLLQAGTTRAPGANVITKPLLIWGDAPTISNKIVQKVRSKIASTQPGGFIYDVFARVGGTNNSTLNEMTASLMMQINVPNVVCDNLWLWRADHEIGGVLVYNSRNPCDTALEVNGKNVIVYGLGAEHTLKDMVKWNGDNGKVYFFQAEYPYDVTQANYGDLGYVAYRLGNKVVNHQAWGLGAYSFFRDFNVTVNSGFATPSGSKPGILFTNVFTRWLNGNGQISHIINNTGPAVDSSHPGPEYEATYTP